MIHRNYVRPTHWEQSRISRMMKLGCIISRNRRAHGLAVPPSGRIECHHLTIPGMRLGHVFTIPLHVYYHQGIAPFFVDREEARELYGASLKHGTRAFNADHGTQQALWEQVQSLLDMPAEWPISKRVPRKTA